MNSKNRNNTILFFCILFVTNLYSVSKDFFSAELNRTGRIESSYKNGNDSTGKKKRETKSKILFSLTNAGFEISDPKFRNGIRSSGYMFGPRLQLGGVGEIGLMRGTTITGDGKIYGSSHSFYMGFLYQGILFRSASFNIAPVIGLRFILNGCRDPYYDGADGKEPNGFGAGIPLGLSIKAGPVNLMAKCNFEAIANFSKGSSFKALSAYPSISIGFSPLALLMNPKAFSHTAMAHWVTDYRKQYLGTTVSTKTEKTGDNSYKQTTTYTSRYKESWKDNFGYKTESATDVQPYFFIGPRASTSLLYLNRKEIITGYGANMGYRRGLWFLNAFAEKASINFGEPFNRGEDTLGNKNIFEQRIDGAFKNSLRYGGQIGIELINNGLGKKFIYSEDKRRFKKVTSYYYCAVYAGYGQVQLGDLQFSTDSGAVAYNRYLENNPSKTHTAEDNVLLTPKKMDFINFGAQLGLGAVAFNVEYNIYKGGYKRMNNINVGMSYNLPVSRMVRALKANHLINKAKRKKRRESSN